MIGVFFDRSKGGNTSNPFFEQLNISGMNKSRGYGTTKTVKLNSLFDQLDRGKGVFYYKGSLTTPPCSQVVNWIVINDPQPITP